MRDLFVTVAGALLVASGAARADETVGTCEAEPWSIESTDASGAPFDLEDLDRVTVIFYEGQKHMGLNEGAKEAIQADDRLGDGGSQVGYVDYFGIANYREIWAPAFLVTPHLKRRIKKFGVPIVADRDHCYSGTGPSKACPGGERSEMFQAGEANIVVLYDRKLLLRATGKVEAEPLLDYLHAVVEAATKGRDHCDVLTGIEPGALSERR